MKFLNDETVPIRMKMLKQSQSSQKVMTNKKKQQLLAEVGLKQKKSNQRKQIKK